MKINPKLVRSFSVCALTLYALWGAHAQEVSSATKATLKAAIERNTQGRVAVDTIRGTPVPGVFEVSSGIEVLYVDSTGRYGFEGSLINMAKQVDMTSLRRDQLSKVDFKSLPLGLAV